MASTGPSSAWKALGQPAISGGTQRSEVLRGATRFHVHGFRRSETIWVGEPSRRWTITSCVPAGPSDVNVGDVVFCKLVEDGKEVPWGSPCRVLGVGSRRDGRQILTLLEDLLIDPDQRAFHGVVPKEMKPDGLLSEWEAWWLCEEGWQLDWLCRRCGAPAKRLVMGLPGPDVSDNPGSPRAAAWYLETNPTSSAPNATTRGGSNNVLDVFARQAAQRTTATCWGRRRHTAVRKRP